VLAARPQSSTPAAPPHPPAFSLRVGLSLSTARPLLRSRLQAPLAFRTLHAIVAFAFHSAIAACRVGGRFTPCGYVQHVVNQRAGNPKAPRARKAP
jgi:hypothetical protein